MTQRRGHWTDDLINAVSDLIYTDYSGDDLEARGWNTALAEVFRILDSGA